MEYELQKKRGGKPQDTIEFWNKELKSVQESYEKKIEQYDKVKKLFGSDLFIIEKYTGGDPIEYDNLEELIQSEFKTI